MSQADSSNHSQFALKSALLMLLGSLLLGFVITRSIFEFQKYYSVLDDVEIEEQIQDGSQNLILDVVSLEGVEFAGSSEKVDLKEAIESQLQETHTDIAGKEIESLFQKIPTQISIPAIELKAKVGGASLRDVTVFGQDYQQWVAPDDVVGWHYKSALLGDKGNTVLNGHHNVGAEVFKNLSLLNKGDLIILGADSGNFYYKVASVMILPERFETEDVRLQNARWIQPSEDERITLISCWPYESNTHRVVVVAFPIDYPGTASGEN